VGRPTTLSEDLELQLAATLDAMADCHRGLTQAEVKILALKLAAEHGVEGFEASRKWLVRFMGRHNLAVHTAGSLDTEHASVSRQCIDEFFAAYKKSVIDEAFGGLEPPAASVYNMDETNLRNVTEHFRGDGVVASRGVRARKLTGTDRGSFTAAVCVRADGYALPPLLIMPGEKWFMEKWAPPTGTPPCLLCATASGRLNSNVMLEWAKVFTSSIPSTRPVVLIVDGYFSHFDRAVVDWFCDNNVLLVVLPSNTTFALQPLDVSFFAPFKLEWRKLMAT
jgi:hypothetical protein